MASPWQKMSSQARNTVINYRFLTSQERKEARQFVVRADPLLTDERIGMGRPNGVWESQLTLFCFHPVVSFQCSRFVQ